jgi:hypothetical protein
MIFMRKFNLLRGVVFQNLHLRVVLSGFILWLLLCSAFAQQ